MKETDSLQKETEDQQIISGTATAPTTQPPSAASATKSPSMLKTVLVSVVINALVLLGAFYYYDRHVALQVETVDLRAYLNEMRNGFVAGKINQEQMKKNFNSLDEHLREIVKNKPNTIILLKEVIVSGQVEEIKP